MSGIEQFCGLLRTLFAKCNHNKVGSCTTLTSERMSSFYGLHRMHTKSPSTAKSMVIARFSKWTIPHAAIYPTVVGVVYFWKQASIFHEWHTIRLPTLHFLFNYILIQQSWDIILYTPLFLWGFYFLQILWIASKTVQIITSNSSHVTHSS